jgi:hypothetical protein
LTTLVISISMQRKEPGKREHRNPLFPSQHTTQRKAEAEEAFCLLDSFWVL